MTASGLTRVVVTETKVWPWLRDDVTLREAGIMLEFCDYADTARMRDRLAQADVFVGTLYGPQLRGAASERLRLILVTAAGVDQIDRADLPPGVTVCNSYGHGRAIAEYVIMTALAAQRGLLWRDRELREGRWRTTMVDPSLPPMRNIDGQTLGIVSVGHVGVEIARLASVVGLRCIGVTRTPAKDFTGRELFARLEGMTSIGRLFADSDIVVVTSPATPDTFGLVGTRLLEALGPDGTLINVGRGAVIVEDELFEALRSGALGSAVLDVWNSWASNEPHAPSALPFDTLDNVIMTPHYCATTEDTYRLRAADLAQNLLADARNAPLQNVLYATPPEVSGQLSEPCSVAPSAGAAE